MSTLRQALPEFLWLLVFCTSFAMLVCEASYAVMRRWPKLAKAGAHMVPAMVTSFVASFTLIVSLLASHMVNDFNKAHEHLHLEAQAIISLHNASMALNTPGLRDLRKLEKQYLREVLTLEWPRMTEGGHPQVERTLHTLQMRVMREGVQAPRSIERPLTNALEQLIAHRATRLSLATAELPSVVWLVLVINVVLTIIFLSFLQSKKPHAGRLTVGLLSIVTATLMASIYLLDNPYVGGVFIGPDLLQEALTDISQNR